MTEFTRILSEMLRLQDSVVRLNEALWEKKGSLVGNSYIPESPAARADRIAASWGELDLPTLADRIVEGRRAIDSLAEAAP